MRRLTKQLAGAAAGAVILACANRGMQPPGGPIDQTPPGVERITPDSGSVRQRPGSVRFTFSRVISDNPPKGQLNQYFLISPTDGEPRVNWHRDKIDVRPRHGWKPNTAYAVTLLPGLTDVRNNAMTQSAMTVFSTGDSLPRFGILGTIFDWAAEKPAGGAFVEAISRPDSTVYVGVADSLGQYVLGPFGPGRYTLLGFVDRNSNRALDPGELWDSTTVLIDATRPVTELLALARDTIPPRIAALARDDSVTLRVTFDRAIDPTQRISAGLFRLQRADSTEISIVSAVGARAATDSAARRDSLRRDSTARRDTTRRDTTAARPAIPPGAPPSIVPVPGVPTPRPGVTAPAAVRPSTAAPLPRPSRRAPETTVLLKLAPPTVLDTGATYRVTARGVRGIAGRSSTSSRTITIPKPPPPSPRDSSRGRDTTRVRRDTTRVPPPRRPPALGR